MLTQTPGPGRGVQRGAPAPGPGEQAFPKATPHRAVGPMPLGQTCGHQGGVCSPQASGDSVRPADRGPGCRPGVRPAEQWQPLLRTGAWWGVSCPGVPPSGPLPRVDTPSSVWRAGGGLGAVTLRRWVFPCPLGRTGQGGPPVVAPQAWGPHRRRCVQVAQVGPAPRPGTVDLHVCTHTHATDLPRTHVRTRAGHAPTCAHTRPLPPRSPQASALR